jgi:hypothetical protein
MPSTTLDVPYHQQESLFFCGAAAAQMVLRDLDDPLPVPPTRPLMGVGAVRGVARRPST